MDRRLRHEEVMAIQVPVERGCSNRSIARQLGVDEKAVRYRRARLQDGSRDGRAGKPIRAEMVWGVFEQWVSSHEGAGVNLRAPTLARARIQLNIASQVDFEWTGEGTDEFLGHGGEATPSKSPDRCLVQAREGLEPEDANEVGASGGATRSRRSLPRKAGVKGRHCLLTTGGLIGVIQPVGTAFISCECRLDPRREKVVF